MGVLYGNDQDFWTSDDDDRLNEAEDQSDNEIEEDEVPVLSPPPLAKLLEYEDPTAAEGFITGPSEIPQCVIVAPKSSMIRKHWVVYDDFPVDNFEEDVPSMAMKYPFELDAFQKRAIRHVHKREHTFVAAHTSAGKTVVAEYAIAVAAQRGRRAIYTSPIKALSNQKFREFKQKFDSVGIITGDVSLNPDAQCLIATTEILRAMLYRGDSIMHQLDVVVFDEVHYVNDAERGVVWEEVIIMLPRDVCLVMLSATVPNYREFADWIGRTKRREVFAIATSKRPTPLKHFLWANDKEFLVMDQSRFRVEAFNELYKNRRDLAKAAIAATSSPSASFGGGRGRGGPNKQRQQPAKFHSGSGGSNTSGKVGGPKAKSDSQRLQSLIRRLEQTDQLPVVIFCFSRKRCEAFPSAMSKLDLLHQQDERSKVHLFIKDSFANLSDADRLLPQVIQVSSFLSRGIGIHHGGLLPIVKEAVEILFAKGLVKVLFATETFAMGVNMPARSVVFASIEKHDGQRMRTLLSSEYTQMAGRAGRRGLDVFGSVFILCQSDDPPDQKEVTKMMMEHANPLESRFRLTFGMLLQLASQQTLRIEDMLSLSFREHSRARRVPTLKRDQARILKELASVPPIECIYGDPTLIERYADLEFSSRLLAVQLHLSLWKHQYALAAAANTGKSTSRGPLGSEVAGSKTASPPFCRGRIIVVHSLPVLRCSSVATIVGVESGQQSCNEAPLFRILVLTTAPPGSGTSPQNNNDISKGAAAHVLEMIESLKNPYGYKSAAEKAGVKVISSGQIRTSYLDSYEPGASFGYYLISSVPLELIGLVSSNVLGISGEDLDAYFDGQDEASLLLAAKSLDRLNIASKGQWTPMTLSKNLRAIEIEFVDTLLTKKDLIAKLNNSLCHACSLKENHFNIIRHRRNCDVVRQEIETLLRVESLHLYDEMKLKYQILQLRQFVDAQGCITLKGQVAAALTTNDDITLTEALLSNVFHNKSPQEVAALLSCFVFPDKVQEVPLGPTQGIVDGRNQIELIHNEIEQQMKAIRIPVVHGEWWRICNFGLSLVAFQWAEGESFASIIEFTEIQEGTIVRAILRLDELIRKVMSCTNRVRRDVVFAKSLYLK